MTSNKLSTGKSSIANNLKPWIGAYWWTLEEATDLANRWTKTDGVYYSTVKGEPKSPDVPHECWAVTNKYDPRVIANEQSKHKSTTAASS